MKVLVAGGAGYIGSHTVVQLCASGHSPVIVDNFSASEPEVVARLEKISGKSIEVAVADIRDSGSLEKIFQCHRPEVVMHFAGLKSVPASIREPLAYYEVNVNGTLSLLRQSVKYGARNFVFSSSATVYGLSEKNPVKECDPKEPVSPYGWSKSISEQMIADVAAAHPDFGAVILRYFNPVGSDDSGLIGEDPSAEPGNLMPLICQTARGLRGPLSIYGTDYDTPDGTGLRDFIHVSDLARGHLAALDFLREHRSFHVFNLGTGAPHSVLELIDCFKRTNDVEFGTAIVGRRPGDVAASWADITKAHNILGWRATRTLEDMCRSAWRWQIEKFEDLTSNKTGC